MKSNRKGGGEGGGGGGVVEWEKKNFASKPYLFNVILYIF